MAGIRVTADANHGAHYGAADDRGAFPTGSVPPQPDVCLRFHGCRRSAGLPGALPVTGHGLVEAGVQQRRGQCLPGHDGVPPGQSAAVPDVVGPALHPGRGLGVPRVHGPDGRDALRAVLPAGVSRRLDVGRRRIHDVDRHLDADPPPERPGGRAAWYGHGYPLHLAARGLALGRDRARAALRCARHGETLPGLCGRGRHHAAGEPPGSPPPCQRHAGALSADAGGDRRGPPPAAGADCGRTAVPLSPRLWPDPGGLYPLRGNRVRHRLDLGRGVALSPR